MDQSQRDGWPPQAQQPPASMNMNRPNEQLPLSRGPSGYRHGSMPPHPQQQQQQQQAQQQPPQQPNGFYSSSGAAGAGLPGMSSMPQGSPNLAQHRSLPPHEAPIPPLSVPAQGQPYSLPGINQTAPGQPPAGHAGFDREREARERELRERELREREFEDQARREQDLREREMRERQQREQVGPHQEQLQIHQPVAVGPRMQTAIHGPNGLLASGGPSVPPPQAPAQNPSMNLFGSHFDGAARAALQQSAQMAPQTLLSFTGPGGMSQMSTTPLAPGQQPILNDALSYLDQVKVQFSGELNVYNQFLDIMKDFKSQTIDTPGVIRRVSTLFAGNPNLIQGFNTFLPPGYRIECGTADDPNAIRVTTPMGTTVSPMGSALHPGGGRITDIVPPPAQYDRPLEGGWHPSEQIDGMLDPATRAYAESLFAHQPGANQARLSPFEAAGRDAAQSGHVLSQQEQRGVAQLQSAASITANDPVNRQTPKLENNSPNANGSGAGADKRPPVEFNHAISYVNKIKNRFVTQPEIYKQFLEILQTYQREAKPIQDVYAQVTQLFNDAPDLLQDFKQFLPESAAHAKAVAARQAAEDMTQQSNLRGEYASQGLQQTPRAESHRLPPVGNFAPTPSANRDVKRKRVDRQVAPPIMAETSKSGYAPNKRVKQSQAQPIQQTKASMQPEIPPVSPTLVPALPEPMPADTTTSATHDELSFFDRVKKHVSNKGTMIEFLKLCNLFSQDLIDKNAYVQRVQNFIGGNPDLFNFFKLFVGYDGKDQIIENKARAFQGRVSLANCRAYGPSYRLLPKKERQKPCSGRDDLCNSVLNDDWASHPTWASEDSGFIAHRKNQYEEHLHRIEEERHDYDHYISILERTIQILVPLAQQRQMRSEDELVTWRLEKTVGGQSSPIMKRAIAKIYSREAAVSVFRDLCDRPAVVLPILLMRAKTKLEEWKASHREWEKVWRDQTQKFFWKSLDHQGINAKLLDKRQFQTKTLQNEIFAKYAEQKKNQAQGHSTVPNYQAKLTFHDVNVIIDASRLLLTYAEITHSTDYPKLTTFVKDFIPLYFGLDVEEFQQRIRDIFDGSPPNGEIDEDLPTAADDSASQKNRKVNGKKSDLLRDVLGRGRKLTRGDKEGSVVSSRASTPDVGSVVDEEMLDVNTDPADADSSSRAWFNHAVDGNITKKRDYKINEPYKRTTYNLYANLPVYCFFRMFAILYERLYFLKDNERDVHDTVRRARAPKAALELRMVDKMPEDFFGDTSSTANYYSQILQMLEEYLQGGGSNTELVHIEEVLRRFYLKNGWMLYSFDKLLSALVRFAINILSNDGKDKSAEILQLFQKDRKKEMTTHQDELNYRKQVEKYAKEGDIYKIAYSITEKVATIRILTKDETTFDLTNGADGEGALTEQQKWTYYISTYESMDATEGVPRDLCHPGVLTRNLDSALKHNNASPSTGIDIANLTEDEARRLDRIKSSEMLSLRISPISYSISWDTKHNEEWWIGGASVKSVKPSNGVTAADDGVVPSTESAALEEASHDEHRGRDGEFEEKFVMNSRWMAGLTRDAVDEKNTEYRNWREGKIVTA